MNTKSRYWLYYWITVVVGLLVVFGIGVLLWSDLDPLAREVIQERAGKITVYALTGLLGTMLLFASLLRHMFRQYVEPVAQLEEETRLIALANAKVKVAPRGGEEVARLTNAINELGAAHIALKTDVQKIVQLSKSGVDEEKRRLEALMAQMPEGVVVCNVDGRILLYNHRAQEIVEALHPGEEEDGAIPEAPRRTDYLGLGRSIFGIVDRRPILHALNYLQRRLVGGEAAPCFHFTTSRRREQFIRIRMAPVRSGGQGADIDGYVLSMADITHRLRADSRRDIFLQSLTIGLQQALGRIDDAARKIVREAANGANGSAAAEGEVIVESAAGLLRQIDEIAAQHAYRLQDQGDPEYILGADLVNVVRETIVDKFGLQVSVVCEAELWLSMNSYTVVRGVNYLVGQLTNYLEIERIDLGLREEGGEGWLTVHWHGDPVKLGTIEEWKECPLMMGATGRRAVSLGNLLAGRGDLIPGSEDEAASVRFKLDVVSPETGPALANRKEPRPVYYEFALWDPKYERAGYGDQPLDRLTYVVFDTETTGIDPAGGDEIISIGGIRVVGNKLRREDVFDQLVDPRRSIPLESLKIHEISPEMLRGMPVVTDVLPEFHRFVEGAVLVAHNAAFDMRFLELKQERAGVRFDQPVIDTLLLSAIVHPNQEPHTLDAIAERFDLPVVGRHTALGDAILTAEILVRFLPLLHAKGIHTLGQVWAAARETPFAKIRF